MVARTRKAMSGYVGRVRDWSRVERWATKARTINANTKKIRMLAQVEKFGKREVVDPSAEGLAGCVSNTTKMVAFMPGKKGSIAKMAARARVRMKRRLA